MESLGARKVSCSCLSRRYQESDPFQVRIRKEDCDALRFHWMEEKDLKVRTLRFTRVLFGLGPSPFLLGGVIKHHLDTCRGDQPKYVEEIERSLYVDDLLTGGQTVQEAKEMKAAATVIFGQACFQLHRWNSNETEVETSEISQCDKSISYAKQQLGVHVGECSLLGMKWNKQNETFPKEVANLPREEFSEKWQEYTTCWVWSRRSR